MRQLERVLGALRFLAGVKVETGRIKTPNGEEIQGFKITIGGVKNPEDIKRTYEDIEKILGRERGLVIKEEHNADGSFKSYSVSTQ